MHARSYCSDAAQIVASRLLTLCTIHDSEGVTVACGASGRLRQGRCLGCQDRVLPSTDSVNADIVLLEADAETSTLGPSD